MVISVILEVISVISVDFGDFGKRVTHHCPPAVTSGKGKMSPYLDAAVLLVLQFPLILSSQGSGCCRNYWMVLQVELVEL